MPCGFAAFTLYIKNQNNIHKLPGQNEQFNNTFNVRL